MSSGSKGDDAPGDGGRGSGPQPQVSGRVVVRGEDHAPGDSTVMSAADTMAAVATARATEPEPAEMRKTPGRTTPGPARSNPSPSLTSPPRATPGPGDGSISDTAPEVGAPDPLLGTTLLG